VVVVESDTKVLVPMLLVEAVGNLATVVTLVFVMYESVNIVRAEFS